MMHAHEIREGFWQVQSGTGYDLKWWTAKRLPHMPGGWYIENSKGREVDPGGPLGHDILAAIENQGGGVKS